MDHCSPSSSSIDSSTHFVYLDKCAVCGKPASKKCGGCSLVFYCGSHHQRVDWSTHKLDCKPYKIVVQEETANTRQLSHMVSLKMLPSDTIIISEYPLVTFEDATFHYGDGLEPVIGISESIPVKCFVCESKWITGSGGLDEDQELYRCTKCGLPVCSIQCTETVTTCQRHTDGDCKVLQDLGIKEKRCRKEIGRILPDVQLLRVIHREKQKGTGISLKEKSSPTWLPLILQAKQSGYSRNLENEDVVKRYPLSLAAIGGADVDRVEVVKLLDMVLNDFSMPVDSKNKRKRALFEKYSFLGHSCAPNTEWWLDTSGYHLKLLVRVIKPILPGEPLTVFRSQDPSLIFNPTILRRQKLQKQRTLLFTPKCECLRCVDPTELGTSLSGVRCLICKDITAVLTCNYYFPSNLVEMRPTWQCCGKNCRSTKTYEQILVITMKAEKELEQIWKTSVVSNGPSAGTCEAVITKLQNFIIKHLRKVLHPNHYLILIARSRINKMVSHFLGCGSKLFLCVATIQPRAYDYCAYKVEYINSYLSFLDKLYDSGNTRVSAKLRYDLLFCEAALLFRDFHEERMGGASFFRRLRSVMDNLTKCQKCLTYYADCTRLVDDVKKFGGMLKKLFGVDFLSSYKLQALQSSAIEEDAVRKIVNNVITRWTVVCESIGLRRSYVSPLSSNNNDQEDGSSNEIKASRENLMAILVDVPKHTTGAAKK